MATRGGGEVIELEHDITVYPPARNPAAGGRCGTRMASGGSATLPVDERWSRKHAHTQRRLCERFAAPVIGTVTCQDIEIRHAQTIVNAAPTPGEGARTARMISALVSAGIDGGYLTNPRLAKVHWRAGESALWVDPAEIPADDDIGRLGRALAAGRHGERDELMANAAAYSGLRWGEVTALTIAQVDLMNDPTSRFPDGRDSG